MTTTDAPTADDPQVDPPSWRPRGRPDRWAAGLLVATLAFLTVSFAFGLLAPRVDTWPAVNGAVPGADDLVYSRIEVTNTTPIGSGPLPDARLVDGGRSVPGLRLVSVGIEPGDAADGPPSMGSAAVDEPRPVTLEPGDTATVTLVWRVTDCARLPIDPPPIPLVFRTPIGLTRTVDARGASRALGENGLPEGQYVTDDPDDLSVFGGGWARWVSHWVCAPDTTGAPAPADP
jgi:hypothetical protein